MYAIIETGGKQTKAQVGQSVDIEKLSGKVGDKVSLKNVVLLNNGKETIIGTPYLNNVQVNCKIMNQGKNKKLIVYKMRPKKHYRKKQGHRQFYSRIFIENIEQDGKIISEHITKQDKKPDVEKEKHEYKIKEDLHKTKKQKELKQSKGE